MKPHISAWGVYGLELTGLDDAAAVLAPAGTGWPRLAVERVAPDPGTRRPEGAAPAELVFDDERATMWLSDTEWIRLERNPEQRVTFATEKPLSDDLVAHPYIALPAAVANRWAGRQILHGGGVVMGGGAWGILGTKEAGKSSTLGWLLDRGLPIVSDDLLVLDGTTVFAGPRTVDLRSEAADVLGGEPVDIQLGRHRWRLRSGEVAPSTPMRGLVYLEWGDAASVEPVPPFERLPFLIANSVLGPTVRDSTAYLELAGLPTLRFTRPRRLDVLDATMSQLVDALA